MITTTKLKALSVAVIGVCSLSAQLSMAGVSAEEAAKLGDTLTPLGAEMAGSADGLIPAWTGGYTPKDASETEQDIPNLFTDEKPLYSITAANLAEYADKLTEGTKRMFELYPDTYRIDVYPTHRTAKAPDWVYENTAANATRATVEDVNGAPVVKGAFAGTPFPIPQAGVEVMWNHLMFWRGFAADMIFRHYLITADGQPVMTTDGESVMQMPFYDRESSVEEFDKDGDRWLFRLKNIGPPIRAGEQIMGRNNVDPQKSQSHVYLTGQRRVRKLPNACCDTPTPATAGVMSFDELTVFSGRLDRFDWKLVGKQEMLIPYNNNGIQHLDGPEALFDKHHLNPDHVRWEMHRVWVVEANLKEGERHQLPRSRYYIDEDTWSATLADRWDAQGELAKTLWALNAVIPKAPGTIPMTSGFYDLTSKSWFVQNYYVGDDHTYRLVDRHSPTEFNPAIMAGRGVR
ncbi:DUF1329 domain-containing protein [Marinobacterium sp. YM272]|uniref:DUF1329 domain-containing protein n=1 Tax=Marinobacterium sp. YM272 TaxID=3421654 RepID=UPI003D7F2ADA